MPITLGIIGATGVVGREILKVLEEIPVPLRNINLYATENSVNTELFFKDKGIRVREMSGDAFRENDAFISSAGAAAAKKWGKKAREYKKLLIDNSSAWRMDRDVPLVVPEINPQEIKNHRYIIANPNCSTIQLVLALDPLQREYGISRVIVSTYQSVSGSGKKAVQQLADEISGADNINRAYPHQIAYNCLPHIDIFFDDGYTREEHKMTDETSKIIGADIPLTATCVRVPTYRGHSESVNVEMKSEFDLAGIYQLWRKTPGLLVVDDPQNNIYPLPLDCSEKNDVYVGRLRYDNTNPRAVNFWVVADNLRKGAATNAVQILKQWMEDYR